ACGICFQAPGPEHSTIWDLIRTTRFSRRSVLRIGTSLTAAEQLRICGSELFPESVSITSVLGRNAVETKQHIGNIAWHVACKSEFGDRQRISLHQEMSRGRSSSAMWWEDRRT